MKSLHWIALLLVIVGAVNWGLVGLFQFDLVAALSGAQFGEVNPISAAIYVLVGISAIVLIPVLARWLTTTQEEPLHA